MCPGIKAGRGERQEEKIQCPTGMCLLAMTTSFHVISSRYRNLFRLRNKYSILVISFNIFQIGVTLQEWSNSQMYL